MATVDWIASVQQLLDEQCQQLSELYIGVSGGVDSLVLLSLTKQWSLSNPGVKLHALHINHGLSPNAAAWQQQVETYCAELSVPVSSVAVQVAKRPRHSLEAQARHYRYSAFFDKMPEDGVILLGHHLNDQVETVFLRLLRGSGPTGLSAMQAVSERHQQQKRIVIVRPLLNANKAQLIDYAHQHHISWVEDESNQSLEYDRNVIRQQVIKPIEQQWPERWEGMLTAVSRSAHLCRQQVDVLRTLLAEKFAALSVNPWILSKSTLAGEAAGVRAELIRYWLEQLNAEMPSFAVLSQIEQALVSRHDSMPIIGWGKHQVRIYQDNVCFLAHGYQSLVLDDVPDLNAGVAVQTAWGATLTLRVSCANQMTSIRLYSLQGELICSTTLDTSLNLDALTVAKDIGHERFQPAANQQPRALSRWFKDWHIAPWFRADVVGIYDSNQLVAIMLNEEIKLNQNAL